MNETASAPCDRCESLPNPAPASGRLFIWPPRGPAFQKMLAHCRGRGCRHVADDASGCIVVAVDGGTIDSFAPTLGETLTAPELLETRALLMAGQEEPSVADFGRAASIDKLTARARAGWLVDMLGENRLTAHFQPIVHAADTTRVFAQECLLRGVAPDGALVAPGRVLDAARNADLLFRLDRAAREAAVRAAHANNAQETIFVNFALAAICDPAFCLRSTLAAIDDCGIDRARVVFEVIESDATKDMAHLARILACFREAGLGVALDDLGAGYASLNLLPMVKPDFVKIDRALIRDVPKDGFRAAIVAHLIDLAHNYNIRVIGEGIETPAEFAWLAARGIDFVQGYLFARPSSEPVSQLPALKV